MFNMLKIQKYLAGVMYFLLVSILLMSGQSFAELVDGEELIDPTAPFLLEVDSAKPAVNIFATINNFDVSSILIREDFRLAVINSQRVREGEFVGSARVVSIDESSVTLNIGGEIRVLSLHGAVIKERSDSQDLD